jgi:hypothetical protein
MNPHPSTLALHQLRLNELDNNRAHLVRAHLATCSTCSSRLAWQEAEHTSFRAESPPAWLDALASAPAPPGTWDRLRAWWAGLRPEFQGGMVLLPVAAALVFTIGGDPTGTAIGGPGVAPVETPNAPPERPKGAVTNALEAWVQVGDSARPLYADERVPAGTRLQLRFNPRGHRFVTFAGRDGGGAVEVYGTVPVSANGPTNAPFALTLDDSPGPQAFYAILTDQHPDADVLVAALARDPSHIAGAEVASLVVPKR